MVVEAVETWQEQQRLTAGALAGLQRHYLALTIHFYFASALRRDLDSGLKIAQDALCEALGINDNLVAEIHLYKRVDRRQPRIELELVALPQVALQAETGSVQTAPLPPATRPKRRRRRRKQRSLEELTIRYNW
jgi:hypothetical protein